MRWFCIALTLTLFLTGAVARRAGAQAIVRNANEEKKDSKGQVFALPFAFYSDNTGLGFGVGGMMSGVGQEQLFLGGAAAGSTNGQYGVYFELDDLQLTPIDRLFLDARVGITQRDESREYIDGNPAFSGKAGSNDSLEQDFIDATTFSAYTTFKFKYVLPIGSGREGPLPVYTLDNGVLQGGATGGTSMNPFESGRTFVEVMPFASWRHVSAPGDEPIPQHEFDTFGVRAGLRWDNTDYPSNPSRGSMTLLRLARDPELFGSSGQFTLVEFEHAQYVPLGQNPWFRQQVLAMDLWVMSEVAGDAPYYTGATLGGYQRLRGYPFARFHDRDAILGTVELRMMPTWKPRTTWRALDDLAEMDWIQFVLFTEVGRVGSSFSADELLTDFKWDAGCGLRLFAHKTVLRADVAFGEEGVALWVMVGQTF